MKQEQIDEIYECIKYNTGSYDDDARSCAEILYNYLGYRKPEWISVDDRLPEDMQEVLCYKGKFWGNLQDVYTYLGDGKWQDDYGNIADTEDEAIAHWMPLPAPPTEKED